MIEHEPQKLKVIIFLCKKAINLYLNYLKRDYWEEFLFKPILKRFNSRTDLISIYGILCYFRETFQILCKIFFPPKSAIKRHSIFVTETMNNKTKSFIFTTPGI